MRSSGGSRANSTGAELEQWVAKRLEERGYKLVPANRFHASGILEKPIYAKQYNIGDSIYERPRFVDLILHHPIKYSNNLVIQLECATSKSASASPNEGY